MSISLKINTKKLLENLEKQNSKIYQNLRFELMKGVRLFESHIIRTQMSGRSGNKGLNRRTGNLARSWLVSAYDEGIDFRVTLGTKTFYAIVHQEGRTIRAKKSPFLYFKIDGNLYKKKEVTIPKRLYIIEDWKTYGANILNRQLAKGILKAL